MFTWICPKCGRDVSPSLTECPNCATPETVAAPPQAPPVQTVQTAQPSAAPIPPPVAAVHRKGLPTWLLTALFALAFGGVILVLYGAKNWMDSRGSAPMAFEAPAEGAASPAKPHPLARHIEVTGLRLTDSNRKTLVRYLVINHSGAEIAELAGRISLRARTAKDDMQRVGGFTFRLPVIGPYESKELEAPLDTNLRVYELPDWQNLSPDVQITSP